MSATKKKKKRKEKKNQTALKLSLYQLIFSVIINKCIPKWLL